MTQGEQSLWDFTRDVFRAIWETVCAHPGASQGL